jgi:hypothetical protein
MGACCTKEKVEDVVEDVGHAVDIIEQTVDAFEDVMDVIDDYIKGESAERENGRRTKQHSVSDELSPNRVP